MDEGLVVEPNEGDFDGAETKVKAVFVDNSKTAGGADRDWSIIIFKMISWCQEGNNHYTLCSLYQYPMHSLHMGRFQTACTNTLCTILYTV